MPDYQPLLKLLKDDLLDRAQSEPTIASRLSREYDEAFQAKRTALSFEEWRTGQIEQVAVAWVLCCVFGRFLEDNGLVERPMLAGVGPRLQMARDEYEAFIRAHPRETDREFLLAVFADWARLPGLERVFGADYNPIYTIAPTWLSGYGAIQLLKFWQQVEPSTGALRHDFTDPAWNTRFLGDLYQDLSEYVRKTYALLQTPDFVEGFILDRTLEPAIATFGLEEVRLIDPACGSGHFLLGAFERLVDHRLQREPGANSAAIAQWALDRVHGVDINPYAIAIARFRLLVAALQVAGIKTLKNAQDFRFNLVCGDALLHGEGVQTALDFGEEFRTTNQHHYSAEDIDLLLTILRPGFYHAVVANPPYIVPKDKASNAVYRARYSSCHRQYAQTVPFMERIFELAIDGGFTGQITSNSFMKREFGKKLIEGFFPRVDLTHVIDTSGAYIPGHGTPTVILFGRNQKPVNHSVRAVLGIRGEPSTPDDPALGLVWQAILNQVDVVGSESEFVSVADVVRETFYQHPWSLGGGGASELKDELDRVKLKLGDLTISIGRVAHTGNDEVYIADLHTFQRQKIQPQFISNFVEGEILRDWIITKKESILFPYTQNLCPTTEIEKDSLFRWLWHFRDQLWNRREPNGSHREIGKTWYEFSRFHPERYVNSGIAFASVATHNHFVLDRGGKVFKQSAPVIKLPPEATERDHLALLGLLNSSIACFWMKQVFHCKGSTVDQHGARQTTVKFEDFYDLDGSKLKQFPIAKTKPLKLAEKLDQLAQTWQTQTPAADLHNEKAAWLQTLQQMIAQQEELDWETYQHYGLITEPLTYAAAPPPIQLGERAFEIIMARQIAAGDLKTTWFERHNSQPITEIPSHWPADYQALIQKRISTIEKNKNLRLIEQPEYKRRWNIEPWESQRDRALQTWLLNRLEHYFDIDGRMNPPQPPLTKGENPEVPLKKGENPEVPLFKGDLGGSIEIAIVSIAQVADLAAKDSEFQTIGAIYRQDSAFDVYRLVLDLVQPESVPLLPQHRHKPSGQRKRQEWEKTWDKQRQEDALTARSQLPKDHPHHINPPELPEIIKKEIGAIAVPPKYKSSDFQKTHYWRLRGKLDVPKERWVSFPDSNHPDGTPAIAWAGYDHLQLAGAIASYHLDLKENHGGRSDPRLIPLLAALQDLIPWLKQWHNDPNTNDYGEAMGDYYAEFVAEEGRDLGVTVEDLRSWEPPQQTKKRQRK
ncbi:BREX-2 system adenine-specific DNA-methyltransferase PglX [Spirulina major CS-329]|uniref:BREX-2 system adenine-specific DNA-methyltransferase PglX n=1 Tax=Spirulina TaxID=1154 RepID=UPI002331260A|nr:MULTISPECIES: BREX-2 system adenine-specific DNA-methyltransferase PglX [Spirulina]MDB9494419.1 BREX-2 system adenine-specific DNA-methyltransferase PglX [Spirulina subsalsa CS-330]MDB9503103.1 BREX-2 system adenine-specific DNA-methyltransferase PglX [Spirulina major CS-329]